MEKKVYEKPTAMVVELEPLRILSGSGGGDDGQPRMQFEPIQSQSLDALESSGEDNSEWKIEHY